MNTILEDLAAEQDSLDALVSGLGAEEWDLPTPAEPWTIRDQIGHLAFFDEKAALAARDPEAFMVDMNSIAEIGVEAFMGRHIERGRSGSPDALLEWWRTARSDLLAALAECDPDERLPWYGPPMRAASSAVARLMETWAHGLDIADTLGVVRAPTDRLFHIADLGVRTFRFAFENRGLEAPPAKVRVALRGPSGTLRIWNDECADSITGPVEDFCMVVTQRRHLDDTHLFCEGTAALRWMEIAQVFAGPPGPGREPSRS